MNKKVMILIVVIECVLAVLLIGVIGLAIESAYKDVTCQGVYFMTESGERIDEDSVVEVERPDRGYQLYCGFDPEETTDKTLKYTTSKPDKVKVNDTGYVTFFEDTDVTITITSSNGKTATIKLVPKRNTHGTVDLD